MDITYEHWREHFLLDLDGLFFLCQVRVMTEACKCWRPTVCRQASRIVDSKETFLYVQAAIPHLEKTKGSIVNISSIGGLRPANVMMPYCVTKSGKLSYAGFIMYSEADMRESFLISLGSEETLTVWLAVLRRLVLAMAAPNRWRPAMQAAYFACGATPHLISDSFIFGPTVLLFWVFSPANVLKPTLAGHPGWWSALSRCLSCPAPCQCGC